MKKTRAEKPLPKNRPSKRVGSGTLVRRSEWTPVNRKRLPKSGIIIGGSWRADCAGGLEWSMSSPCSNGWGSWFDDDRTHFLRLPNPPNIKDVTQRGENQQSQSAKKL